jgi:hypothetical protein
MQLKEYPDLHIKLVINRNMSPLTVIDKPEAKRSRVSQHRLPQREYLTLIDH